MLISFIIPVFNAEHYLSDCLKSIINQGLAQEDFEIILVDDCSTDSSLQICRDYCSKYNNISLIENESNIGIGFTRNRGMSIARGDYVHFVDSDDLILPNSLRDLLSLNVVSKSPDIIRFRSSSIVCSITQNEIIFEGKYNDNYSFSPHLSAWGYWFRRHFLIENRINYLDKKNGEDAIFTFTALSKKPFIIITSSLVYFYRRHGESITSKCDIGFVNCLFEVADEIKKMSTNPILSASYITEIHKDLITRFYKRHRSLQECKGFKKKMQTFDQYSIITNGPWYLQLSRIPLLLYLYLLLKR